MTRITDLAELGRQMPTGVRIAVPHDHAGVSMAMTWGLLRRGCDELHIVCVPNAGMQMDLLIGRGLVATLATSAITLGEAGGAPGCSTGWLKPTPNSPAPGVPTSPRLRDPVLTARQAAATGPRAARSLARSPCVAAAS